MLQTDAHNPNIKEQDKMKFTSFQKTARGINDGENIPEDQLLGYYNRIKAKPLAIRQQQKAADDAEEARK